MSIAARVKHFLDQNRAGYQILSYERTHILSEAIRKLKIPLKNVLKTVPITDGITHLLAILPLEFEIDFVSIELELQGVFRPLSYDINQSLFFDCDKGCVPPIGAAYHLQSILDSSIEKLDMVYIETGSSSALLEMSIDDFLFLNGGAPMFSFANPKDKEYLEPIASKQSSKLSDITNTFPSLPILAQKIFKLAETLMTHHRSPLFKNGSRYFKFGDFDHVALALATHQIFRLPKEVFLGSRTFWKHALYAAALSEALTKKIGRTIELDPELCYLLGFTHNFGFLLFNHLFFHEYRLLSKWIQQNPEEPIECLEKRLLGMGKGVNMVARGHTELGAWLMEYWNMPEIFVFVAKHHHDRYYEGPYAYYIALIQLTNQLLKKIGIGKESSSTPIEKTLKFLGISLETADSVLADLMANLKDSSLEEMALHLAS